MKTIYWYGTSLTLALAALALLFFTGVHHLLLHAVPLAVSEHITSELFLYILAGFVAQMIDGALGMAYGVSSTTFLMAMGVPAAAASASVHTSEIFTSGVSGLMHLKFGNVNRKLFQTLLLPGVVGAILGAYILSSMEEYDYIIKPIVSGYTFVLGILILRKAYALRKEGVEVKNVAPLAIFGGFMDSIGGGGWGPIVSSTLMARGNSPRFTIGSVNLAEFFVALASSLTFFTMIGLMHWQVIVGLIIGGVFAAPIGASLTKRLPVKTIMLTVGVLVILISSRTIVLAVLALL
ncbi:sulfite exporter TauE/SafE family protein [Pontibacter sp. E15-1]|uniref:sulfite exporter TauE/SafE family protein n=1 Tax=Pontibacter sp. E15-1 TaxID=2919918 RepID=UPI001F4F4DA2|nr:sulfite exporter TauE/SafE family protein [Pontibacter sp. E15-1]MCJ8164079.1 sulfite exporter TauE/SafE family protein [Pontibacter sp. E15-1]